MHELFSVYSVIHIVLGLYSWNDARRLIILLGSNNDLTPY